MAETNIKVPPTSFKTEFEPGDVGAAIANEDIRKRNLLMVPIDDIHTVADFNVRVHNPTYEAHIESIKGSIIRNGFQPHNPLKVYVGKEGDQNLFYLCGGYSRFEAAKRAKAEGHSVERVPCVVTPKGTSMIDLVIGVATDNDNLPLSPYEKGIVAKRLQALDKDDDEIAQALGITRKYVADLLGLMGAPKAIHNMVINGEVSAGLAMDTIQKTGGGKKAVEALKAAGATGETGGGSGKRVTSRQVNTDKPNKRLYEILIEYLVTLNSSSGAASAIDFLIRWQEKDKDAVKEMAKLAAPKKKKEKAAEKPKNPKDVRIKVLDTMTDDEKKAARAHNKEVKARKERREARAEKKAAETPAIDPPAVDPEFATQAELAAAEKTDDI